MARVKNSSSPNATASSSPFYVRHFHVLLTLIAAVCYLRTLSYEFLPTDDTWLIALKLEKLRDIRNLPSLFSEATYDVFYRPLLHASYMLDAQLPGETVKVMHLTNLLLHIFVCCVLYQFLKLIRLRQEVAAVLCFVFALHPMNTQAVAWISGRNDSLLALFLLLSCITMISGLRSRDYGRLFLHSLFFAAALLTKETALVFPCLYLLLILLFVPEWKKQAVFTLVPLWTLLCALRLYLQYVLVPGTADTSPLAETMMEFLNGVALQTGKVLLPFGQSPYPIAEHTTLWPYVFIISLTVFAAYRFGLRNKQIALLAAFWFAVLMVLPTWFGASISPAVHYEHRVYTALPGILLLVSQINFPVPKLRPTVAVPVLLLLLFVLTIRRGSVYENYFSYVENCVNDAPSVAMFQDFAGLGHQQNKRNQEAIQCFNNAIALDSMHAEFYNHRGVSWLDLQQYRTAIADFNKAESLHPYQRETSYNLSLSYYYVKDYNTALLYLREADSLGAVIDPEYAAALDKALYDGDYSGLVSE